MSFIHSIKFRFTIWYLLVLAVLLIALSGGVYFYLSRSLYRNLDRALAIRSTQLCSIQDILESIRQGEFQEQLGEIVILYFYSGDQLVEVSAPGIGVSLSHEFVSKTIAGSSAFTTSQTVEGERLRLVAVSINLSTLGPPPGIQPAALVIGRSTRQIENILARLVGTFVIAVLLTLALAAGGGIFLARRALKASQHKAALMPLTLLAAMLMPMPVPQIRMP